MIEALVYAFVTILTLGLPAYYWRQRAHHRATAIDRQQSATESGLSEPPSLHPIIDPIKCIGCATCVGSCPEGEILGLVNGKAELVEPTRCIGHGACKTACPVGAIELVFGTATRGIDIPTVKPNFESNVDGMFIAGELGGMGLIRNAVEQGRQAMEQISISLSETTGPELDVFVVGAGPAGIAATLQAIKSGLRYALVDQAADLGGTVLSFPRQKLVMTAPMEIPLYGKYRNREISKEELLQLFKQIVKDSQVKIGFNERVESINRQDGQFTIVTNQATYQASRVLLAIGRRGTPRKLGVPGEDLPKVAYELLEPEQYKYKKLLVVGGGDSAIEAAVSLSEAAGTDVTVSYRKSAFSRIKENNRNKLDDAVQLGRITLLLESNMVRIEERAAVLNTPSGEQCIDNDFVFVFAGGNPPTQFLNAAGIEVETKFGAL